MITPAPARIAFITLLAAPLACAHKGDNVTVVHGDEPAANHSKDTAAQKPLPEVVVDPGQMFIDELETHLMRAKTVHIKATLVATGAVNAALVEEVSLGDGQKARMAVTGKFEGRDVDTWFVCDGKTMKVKGKDAAPADPEVRDAIVIGMVRMGLLHNAGLLVGGSAPEHSRGGLREFVKAERPRAQTPATDIKIDVVVHHDVMGEATLSLDETASLKKRHSELHFEEGDLVDDESYRVVLDGPIDDAVFALAPASSPAP
ncbi:MAG TPA: hypothetical protein VGO62_11415 [Myxococcota bacterium]|jgi:hypothetical protein